MSEMSKSLSLRDRVLASNAVAPRATEEPVKSGRPHVFDRDFSPLDDIPIRSEMTSRERIVVLARLVCCEQMLHQLVSDASDLGLAATWLRLASVEDDVGDAIVKVTAAIKDVRSV
jgi:hypothetical protein